tara:strand:- start:1509 stop:1706 length:198 start_codon:yes stop_codon:yes gene_type:complete
MGLYRNYWDLDVFLVLLIGSINSNLKTFKKFFAGSTKVPSLFTAVESFSLRMEQLRIILKMYKHP